MLIPREKDRPRDEGDELFRAILEAPRDDGLRLIYADWIDEHFGDSVGPAAELIRLQVRAEAAECAYPTDPSWPLVKVPIGCSDGQECVHHCPRQAARNRAKAILKYYSAGAGGSAAAKIALARDRIGAGLLGALDLIAESQPIFRRGFVAKVSLSMDLFMARAGSLFLTQPIEEVAINDINPIWEPFAFWCEEEEKMSPGMRWMKSGYGDSVSTASEGWGGYNGLPDHVRLPLEKMMFRNHADAMRGLSNALIHHGRELAGLLPLQPAESRKLPLSKSPE